MGGREDGGGGGGGGNRVIARRLAGKWKKEGRGERTKKRNNVMEKEGVVFASTVTVRDDARQRKRGHNILEMGKRLGAGMK